MIKQILVCFHNTYIGLLVPKKRGTGFLKVPFGHHAGVLSQVERDIDFDIFGLENELEVRTGYVPIENQEEYIQRVIKPISETLGFPYRIVLRDEYFKYLGSKCNP